MMVLSYGEIVPGVCIGSIALGISKEELLALIGKDCVVRRYDPIVEIENALFTFEDGRLCQICVTYGFKGNYKNIYIGSTMLDVQRELGDWIKEGDSCAVWQPCEFPGICFELGDYGEGDDEWDELVAPIEWICVYRVEKNNTGYRITDT